MRCDKLPERRAKDPLHCHLHLYRRKERIPHHYVHRHHLGSRHHPQISVL